MAEARNIERQGEAILRASLAEYRRCQAMPDGIAAENARFCAGAFLWHSVLQAHGMGQDEIPATPIGVEVDGVVVVIDPGDGLERGLTVHVIERSNVIGFGKTAATRRGKGVARA